MKDDELEVWRRQWHAQPAAPIDLIRRVERQTVYMRLDWIAQVLPGLMGAGTVVAAVIMRTTPWIFLAAGIWVFIIIGWFFMIQNSRGVWAPVAETTAAYLELSIERCRRKLINLRFSIAFGVLLTAFVITALYQVLSNSGALKTTTDAVPLFLVPIVVVSVVIIGQAAKRKRTQAELAYLLDVQQKLETGDSRSSF
jgi:hypothetical protein